MCCSSSSQTLVFIELCFHLHKQKQKLWKRCCSANYESRRKKKKFLLYDYYDSLKFIVFLFSDEEISESTDCESQRLQRASAKASFRTLRNVLSPRSCSNHSSSSRRGVKNVTHVLTENNC